MAEDEHDEDGYMLAAIHAIGRNAVNEDEIAEHLANKLLARYQNDSPSATDWTWQDWMGTASLKLSQRSGPKTPKPQSSRINKLMSLLRYRDREVLPVAVLKINVVDLLFIEIKGNHVLVS